jgi:hypothetical protein
MKLRPSPEQELGKGEESESRGRGLNVILERRLQRAGPT